nr:MAG TPA: Nuclease [Caudoviricetes sp.]
MGNPGGRKTAAGGYREEGEVVRENEVEKAFVDAVKEAGGKAVKFTSQTMNGVPDRLVLLPCGKCAFVELKAPGKQMRSLQRKRRELLLSLGFPVFCVDRPEQIQPVMKALGEWKPGEPVPTGVGAEIPELINMILPGERRHL